MKIRFVFLASLIVSVIFLSIGIFFDRWFDLSASIIFRWFIISAVLYLLAPFYEKKLSNGKTTNHSKILLRYLVVGFILPLLPLIFYFLLNLFFRPFDLGIVGIFILLIFFPLIFALVFQVGLLLLGRKLIKGIQSLEPEKSLIETYYTPAMIFLIFITSIPVVWIYFLFH